MSRKRILMYAASMLVMIAYASDEHDLIEFDIRYGLYNGIGNDPPFFSEMEEIYHGQEGEELIIRDYAQDPDGAAIYYRI